MVTQLDSGRLSPCPSPRALHRKNIAHQRTVNALQTTGPVVRGVWVGKPAGGGPTAREIAHLPWQPRTALPLILQHQKGNVCLGGHLASPARSEPFLALASALDLWWQSPCVCFCPQKERSRKMFVTYQQ